MICISRLLAARGHQIGIVAPEGSIEPPGVKVYQAAGTLPPNATTAAVDAGTALRGAGAVEAMWETAARVQRDYDVIAGMTYDLLAYYVTPFFRTPVAHWITIASAIAEVDNMIARRYAEHPRRFAFYSRAQAATFPFVDAATACLIPGGVDTSLFAFSPSGGRRACWAARISREKGLEDAFAVAERLEIPLDVCGAMQDTAYWDEVRARHPRVEARYLGLLGAAELAAVMGRSMALLVTPRWVEAFGSAALEAMSCGTPVVAYRRGGPAEFVEDGASGFLVEQGDVAALAGAVRRVPELDRRRVRARAEQFTFDVMADRVVAWLRNVTCPTSER